LSPPPPPAHPPPPPPGAPPSSSSSTTLTSRTATKPKTASSAIPAATQTTEIPSTTKIAGAGSSSSRSPWSVRQASVRRSKKGEVRYGTVRNEQTGTDAGSRGRRGRGGGRRECKEDRALSLPVRWVGFPFDSACVLPEASTEGRKATHRGACELRATRKRESLRLTDEGSRE
jgi:hypothetical protein